MLPVKQSFVSTPNGFVVPGDCIRAAVASVLDLHIELVPHFLLFDKGWGSALADWLYYKNLGMVVYTDDESETEGWKELEIEVRPLAEAPDGVYMVASGDSPNVEGGHALVSYGKEVVHDVHPSNKGLLGEPWEYWHIFPKL